MLLKAATISSAVASMLSPWTICTQTDASPAHIPAMIRKSSW